MAKAISAIGLQKLSNPGIHPLGGNMDLRISPSTGKKTFRVQVSRTSHAPFKKMITLGDYPTIGLKEARELAGAAKISFKAELIGVGDGGKHAVLTFLEAATAWYEANKGAWGKTNATDVLGNIKEMCDGSGITADQGFGSVKMTELRIDHITRIADGVLNRGAHSVVRDLLDNARRIVNSYNARVDRSYSTYVRAEEIENLKRKGLPPKPKEQPHPYLYETEMPLLLALLSKSNAVEKNKTATKILLLTGVRSANVRQMQIQDLDFEKNLWFITGKEEEGSGQRTKNENDHLVPLSRQAAQELNILINQRQYLDKDDPIRKTNYIFFGDRAPSVPISENTMRDIVVSLGYKGLLTPHGFRHTLSSWAHAQIDSKKVGWSSRAVEEYLQHEDNNKIRKTYNHSQFIEQRREIAQAWADQIDRWLIQGLEELAKGMRPHSRDYKGPLKN